MKLQKAARDGTDEDPRMVGANRGSIALFKERLYRFRPRVQNQEVGVEHGPKPDRVVEMMPQAA